MLIVGAKGFAKELLEVCHQLDATENLVFYDDVSTDLSHRIFDQFDILQTPEAAHNYFKNVDDRFALGLGLPELREKMSKRMEELGGTLVSLVSPKAHIGSFGVEIGVGATILPNATVSNGAKVGKGILMYPNSIITHDCQLGDFVELSPGATILGGATLKDFIHIGTNATVLPRLSVGSNSVIGAGAVVTVNVAPRVTVKGIPAK